MTYERQILVNDLLRFTVVSENSARTNHVMENRNRHTKEKIEDPIR